MTTPIEQQYRDLLQPIKDAEKSFEVDIAQLLQNYITSFVEGKVPANFNSAALLLQGSSSIYSKKVEYLFNLASQLYHNLVKNKTDGQAKPAKVKSQTTKVNKFSNPYFSTEITLGKNLSCLKKKAATKNASNKKTSKKNAKKVSYIVPIDLLPFEGEEKGEQFYDTRNELVGRKGDYTLNKCRVTASGWLLLPTISLDQVPKENSPPDYSCSRLNSSYSEDCDMPPESGDCDDMPESNFDEGVDTGSLPPSQATSTPDLPMSQQTDEGLGSMTSTPTEPLSQPDSEPMECTESVPDSPPIDMENIPINDIVEDLDILSKSVRQSDRQALKLRQLVGEPPEEVFDEEKRAIQKKNTCLLPSKLRLKGNENKDPIEYISNFCAKKFFSGEKRIKNGMLSLEVMAFKNNPLFVKRLEQRWDEFKAATRKSKHTDDDDDEIDTEVLNGPDTDLDPDDDLPPPLQDADIIINNDPIICGDENPIPECEAPSVEVSSTEAPPANDDSIPNFDLYAQEQIGIYHKSLAQYVKTTDTAKKVQEWETHIAPFLHELNERESFDINLYGSRILNSFEHTEGKQRRQTKSFRDFCKGMQKWQIHRYFMALLPLANIGNVSLDTEERPDGEEEILITLITKKMHHLELEEFGNNEDHAH